MFSVMGVPVVPQECGQEEWERGAVQVFLILRKGTMVHSGLPELPAQRVVRAARAASTRVPVMSI